MLYERRERNRKPKRFSSDGGWETLIFDKVKREFHGGDLEGELGILKEAGFIRVDGEDEYEYGAAEIGLQIPVKQDDLRISFVEFIVENKLSFRKVIGEVDLSGF